MACFNGVDCHRVEVVVGEKLSHVMLLQGKAIHVMLMYVTAMLLYVHTVHMSLARRNLLQGTSERTAFDSC